MMGGRVRRDALILGDATLPTYYSPHSLDWHRFENVMAAAHAHAETPEKY